MSKFTSGEWYIDDTPCIKGYIWSNTSEKGSPSHIAHVTGIEDEQYKAKAEANARLIVNAPKMYECLKLLARILSLQAREGTKNHIDPAIINRIYELLAKIDNEPVENMKHSSSFFQNRSCEYFPCHSGVDEERFSCLFCFCPLYHMEHCPGTPQILSNGIKDCSACSLPHTNYQAVINALR